MALYLSFREADCPQFNSTVLKSYILTFIPNEMERIKWPKTGTAVEAEEGCTCPVGGDIESVLLISVRQGLLVWPGYIGQELTSLLQMPFIYSGITTEP